MRAFPARRDVHRARAAPCRATTTTTARETHAKTHPIDRRVTIDRYAISIERAFDRYRVSIAGDAMRFQRRGGMKAFAGEIRAASRRASGATSRARRRGRVNGGGDGADVARGGARARCARWMREAVRGREAKRRRMGAAEASRA